MYDILTLNAISNKIYTVFDDNYAVSKECAAPDAILVRSFKMDDYEINDNLLAIGRAGAGVNNIPVARMTEAGICVFNTPGANANAVKELVICGMLLASRDIIGGNAWANSLGGDDVAKQVEKGKSAFGGIEIEGKTLGIIGLGAIGIKVACAAKALGMDIIGYDPYLSEANKDRLPEGTKIAASPEEIYPAADFITLHVPLLDTTREMINASSIAAMKPGVVILNMARGELANIADVKEGIAAGKIRNYVVDFPNADCLNTKGIIVVPHLGASTVEAEDNCAVMAAAQIKDYLENGNVVNSVNFPALKCERTGNERLTVVYKAGAGVPEAVEKILAGKKYTLNKAERGSLGYAIVDIDDVCNGGEDCVLNAMSDLDDVISVRVL